MTARDSFRSTIDLLRLIDETPISLGQWRIIGICALLSMLDGFDLQAIAFAAPVIKAQWGLTAADLGPVFSAGLFGGMLGGFAVGPLSDHVGPRRVLAISALVIGLTMLATILAHDVTGLIALRAATGIGLGAASPAIVATLSAFAPQRVRATVVTLAFCAQLLGALLGSVASAGLLAAYGWASVFVLGGLIPLMIAPLVLWLVPEPLSYLIRSNAPERAVRSALTRIGRLHEDIALTHSGPDSGTRRRASALAIFAEGRAGETVLFLLTCLTGGTFFYFLASWLPTILHDDGASLSAAVYGSTALNLGGLAGSLVFARMIDRYGPYRIMSAGYLLGGLLVATIAIVHASTATAIGLVGLAAFFGLGAQYCIPGVIVLIYPPDIHGAGTGFALGFARIGAVVGPLVGSYILLMGGGSHGLFLFAAIAALCASLCVYLSNRSHRHARRQP